MIALDVYYKSLSHIYVLKLYLHHHIKQLYFQTPTPCHAVVQPDRITVQTSLRSRLSRMPNGRHIKEERKKYELETSLSTAAAIKLGTRPSPRHAP
jgi:hypothetical protein